MVRKSINYSKYAKIAFAVLFILLVHLLAAVKAAATDRMNSSYIYFGSPSSYFTAVSNARDALDIIYPSYFDLNADGSLKLTTAVSQGFVDEMHRKGIKVAPFLSNHWNRTIGRAALANRAALASQIAAAIADYNLDGVNVDLENLTPDDRANYVDFIRLLSIALPDDKEISVAVAANPYGTSKGWQGSYDYAGMAEYSDYLVIMAYDESYETGPAGPVASIPFVEKSLQYAVKNVPHDKIVLAVPFYGRMWRDGGDYPNGYGVSNRTIDNLITEFKGKKYYDSRSQTSYAKITIRSGDRKPVIGGKTLTAGTYTIWYSDEGTVKRTLTLADKYDILGASSWSLGQESANTWSYFNLWLAGCYFVDIQYHWARDSIFNAYTNGWVKGVSSSAFAPENALTRAQAAVMLVRALGLPVSVAETQPSIKSGQPGVDTGFSDISGHWAEAEIETARRYDIVNGVGDGRFDPDSPVTREQMAVMLNNMMVDKLSGNTLPVFNDVSAESNSWSYIAIRTVSGRGIYTGFEDGSFRPSEKLTRAQMAVIIERLYDSNWAGFSIAVASMGN